VNKGRLLPVWTLVLIDLLLVAVGLLSFAYFHHVRIFSKGIQIESGSGAVIFTKPPVTTLPATSLPQQSVTVTVGSGGNQETPSVTPPVSDVIDTSGDFGQKFGHLFARDESVSESSTEYRSHDVYMKYTKRTVNGTVFLCTDIYVRNIENIFTAYAPEEETEFEELMGSNYALAAISGDFLINPYTKIAVRNGVQIKKDSYITLDMGVLYYDGSFETYKPSEYDWESISARTPYQIWNFGPELLDSDGKAYTSFNSSIAGANPRTAFGYFEPGHYCFVVAQGRYYLDSNGRVRSAATRGATLVELAQYMEELGCTKAYNLDGGYSSHMGFGGEQVSNIVDHNGSDRKIWDIVGVREIS